MRHEDSPAVKELVGENDSTGRKLADSFRELRPKRSPDESSFNDWKGTRERLADRFHFAHERIYACCRGYCSHEL